MFFIANIKKVKKKKNHWRMQVEDELFEVEGWSQNYGPARCVGREEEFLIDFSFSFCRIPTLFGTVKSNGAVRSAKQP